MHEGPDVQNLAQDATAQSRTAAAQAGHWGMYPRTAAKNITAAPRPAKEIRSLGGLDVGKIAANYKYLSVVLCRDSSPHTQRTNYHCLFALKML